MTLEHGLRRTVTSRAIAHALYGRGAKKWDDFEHEKRVGGIAAWLAKWWDLILGVA